MERAYDINNGHLIVGDAHNSITGAKSRLPVDACARAETYALFIAGLALMAAIRSRRDPAIA